MAVVRFLLDLIGTTPIELIGTTTVPMPIQVGISGTQTVLFSVDNPFDRSFVVSDVEVTVTGTAASKINPIVAIPEGGLILPAGSTTDFHISFEVLEPVFEGETCQISIAVRE